MSEFEKLKPTADKVLARRIEVADKTPGGIYIPDAAKEKAQQAKVIAVGPGKVTADGKVMPMALKVGDVVFFGKYAGTEVGQDYLIIREDEILGTL